MPEPDPAHSRRMPRDTLPSPASATASAQASRSIAHPRLRRARRFSALTLLIWLATVFTAAAQEPATRAEADRQRREQKAQEVQPYEPKGFERAMKFAENRAIFLLDREGFYPKF